MMDQHEQLILNRFCMGQFLVRYVIFRFLTKWC